MVVQNWQYKNTIRTEGEVPMAYAKFSFFISIFTSIGLLFQKYLMFAILTCLIKYINEYNLSQREIAKKIGKSDHWVGNRLKLVIGVSDYVRRLFDEKKLTAEQFILNN